ncbi:hypothetical protein [Nocardia terpenica]|uniref:Transmembrane protein n=1 Tax=Nocardia terpenica TaxID=455432 RepID=A0A291RHZ3_9NOCA|nr:hypothetical protein [Nocardia terpenica]ATL67211.1 hypothetical protein CRH09_14420 [Nocardia terpenica]
MSAVVDDPIVREEGAARPGWFVSPRVDIVLVLGLGALLSVILSLTTVHKGAFLVAAVAFSVLSDYPHVLATSARIWLDPRERQRYWRHYLVSWVAVATVLSALMFGGATVVVVAVWAYWQVFHVLKQHFGIINIYAAKNGYRGPRNLLKYSLFAACLAPFVYRASQGLHFSDYVVLGHRLPFSGLTIPAPPLPMPVVIACFGVAAVLVALFAAEQVRLHRAGQRGLPAMSWATFALAVVSYNLSYLLVSDLFALILIATTTHSLQYHLINWTRNNTRFRLSADPAERRLLLARLSSRRALPLYVLGFAIVGVIAGQLDTVLLGVIPLSFVFHHFYMDGALWKSKGNPELAYDLGIAAPKR